MNLQKTPIALAFALIGAAPLVAQAAPTVSFKTPAAGAILSQPINQSSACEVTGTNIKRVVFSIVSSTGSTTALNTEGSAPWNCNIDPRNFPSGQYTLRAVAYDATSGGASATATRSVTLQNGTTSGGGTTTGGTTTTTNPVPVVTITAPANNSTLPSGAIGCVATATDADGIQQLQWLLNGTLISTELSTPYNDCKLNTTSLPNGTHTLKAVATDKKGAKGEAQITFTKGTTTTGGTTTNTPPTVSVTSPGNGATVSGTAVSCAANATDSNGITQVVFSLDGTTLSTDSSSPYTCSFDSTKLANGSHTLKAEATDGLGAKSSTQVSFNVSNSATTGSGPTVSFKTPADGAAITKAISQSSACEVVGSGIVKVQFFLGATALNTEGSAPWNCNIDPAKFAAGTYPLKAVAYNSSGASSSAQINVNIGSGTTTNTPPTVSLTAPVVGATLSGTAAVYAATASDTGGSVAKVDFYLVNASGSQTLVGTDTTNDYAGSFDTTKFANGTYRLMAVATDNLGASATTERNVNISNTLSDSVSGGGTSAIASSDIITRASADIPFAQQGGYNVQVINNYTSAPSLPESGIHGTTLPNGETLRFGKVADPTDSIRKALAFQVHTSDPLTSSGKRSELSVTPNIEMNKVYWIAFSAYVYDWGTLTTADDALFGTQVHTGDNDAKVGGPSLALVTTQTGRKFQVYSRYSESSTPSGSNSVSVRHTEYDIPFGRWADFVFKFKHNTSGNGLLQAWMDGQMIANYTGSLGFNTGMADYAKFGYYNWSGTSMNSTARKVLLRSPTIVADPTGSKYSQEQLRALVSAGSSSTSGSIADTGGTTTASSGLCSTIQCASQ